VELRELGENHVRTITTQGNLANLMSNLGRIDEAERLYRESLANAHLSQGSLAQAESLSEAAFAGLRRVVGEDHLSTLNARAIRAHTLWRSGRLDEAVAEFREILEARSRSAGDDHPATQRARADLAAALRESGSNAEAESIGRPSP